MTDQPDALRLADELDAYHTRSCHKEAAAELRRLHDRDTELCAAWARAIQRTNELEAEAASLREQNDTLDRQLAGMEREFRQLLDKHNALHMNARAGRERITALEQAGRLALEALEAMQTYAEVERKGLRICDDAIAALREALEQQQQYCDDCGGTDLECPLKHPQQEPAAHVDHRIHGWPDCFVMEADPPHTSPLYTASPRREWVGLTDDDAQGVIQQAMQTITGGANTFTLSANGVWLAIIRSVEAKLREKNA